MFANCASQLAKIVGDPGSVIVPLTQHFNPWIFWTCAERVMIHLCTTFVESALDFEPHFLDEKDCSRDRLFTSFVAMRVIGHPILDIMLTMTTIFSCLTVSTFEMDI